MLPESLQRRSPHSPPWATHVTAMQALLTVCLQVGNGNVHPIFQRLPRRLDYGTCHLLPPGWYTRSTLHTLAGDVAGCSALVIPLPQLDSELLPAGTRASPSFISHVFTPSRVSIWRATSWIGTKRKWRGKEICPHFFSLLDSGSPPRAEQPEGAGGMGSSVDKACASLGSCV